MKTTTPMKTMKNTLFFRTANTMTADDHQELNDYLDALSRYPRLSQAQEAALARRSLLGDRSARDELVCANLRLVVHIASKFRTKRLPLCDLIQSGNEALIHAAEHYDPDAGVRFASYAGRAIQNAIIADLGEDGFHVSAWVRDHRRQVWNASERFFDEYHRDPTTQELSKLTGLSLKELQSVSDSLQSVSSLDELFSDENVALAHTIEDTRVDVEAEAVNTVLLDEIKDAMSVLLTPRERIVIALRFDLGPKPIGRVRTHEEIGRAIGCVKENARQIELSAIGKLKAHFAGHIPAAAGKRQLFMFDDTDLEEVA